MSEPNPNSYPRLTRQTTAPKAGIVHFGPGAFFRAFNVPYTENAMAAQGADDWGIIAVSLKSTSARDSLQPQGYVYTALEMGAQARTPRVINAIADILVAPEDPEAVINVLIDPAIKIASLTVTEKGYCHNPSTGRLDRQHPDIQHDLSSVAKPRSVLGFLVAAFDRRRQAGVSPFTVLSCDNLPSNGRLLRSLVLEFAAARDPQLADWVEAHVPFPRTMVDRITPATTKQDIAELAETARYFDPACVVHEPFRQWVIEDNFADGRPAWEQVGVQFVENVEAHELMKLRCLNGTHSTLAYLGYLAGFETISDTVSETAFACLCEKLWSEEILPTVPCPQGEDLSAYCSVLLRRYQNPAVRHRTWQIAMDGSQKLPQRLLATILENLKMNRVPRGLSLAVAGWMKYVGGVDENGQPIDVRDPMAADLASALAGADEGGQRVAALLSMKEIFDSELAENAIFRQAVTDAYDQLEVDGSRKTVGKFAG